MNFGGMPRGGGRKVPHTHAHRFVLGCMRFRLFDATVLLCVAAVRAAMRGEIQSIFFFLPLLSRAKESSGVDLSKTRISLFTRCSGRSSGLVGVFQNALFLEERERDERMCLSDLPPKTSKGKRERRPTLDFTHE